MGFGQGETYIAKFYPETNLEGADRLDTEFASLGFLSNNGVKSIPIPVAADQASRCAIYKYVEGEPITPDLVTEGDIDRAAGFLSSLRQLNGSPGSSKLPAASDSFFSLEEARTSLQGRLKRLNTAQGPAPQYSRLRNFLGGDYLEALNQIIDWCRETADDRSIGWDANLAPVERTLSPSDFGFHNALREPGGGIVFLDFEYFGWDDPAKMISDFLLHPAMELEQTNKQRFVNEILGGFLDFPRLAQRLEIVYPLSGLKWCLIILNEFLPDIWQQRASASAGALDQTEAQDRQLAKASQMLQRIKCEYRNFPYRN